METIKISSRSDKKGILHLDIPVGINDTDLEVTVTVKPSEANKLGEGYPPKFFEQTYGICQDDPILLDEKGIIEETENYQ